MRFSVMLATDADTQRLGEDLALALRPGDVLALSGDLGAGKSTLARALIRAVADDPDLEVPSPTFTLVQSYVLRLPIAHFDFYRLSSPDELDELGFHEMLEDGACLVEWPDRMPDSPPLSRIHLTLTHEGEGRRAEIEADGKQAERIARSLTIRDFLREHGHAVSSRRYLTGDASVRAYEYLPLGDGSRLILMDWPRPPEGPPVLDGKPYPKVAHIAEDAYPFIAIASALRERSFAAPEILAADCDKGILLLSDLGEAGVLDAEGRPIEDRYQASVKVLARLHAKAFPTSIPVEMAGVPPHIHTIPPFDRTAMSMEVRLLLDWYLPWKTGREATEDERQAYLSIWSGLIDRIEDGERNLLLRDYHSPNIVWRPEQDGLLKIGILDFQDSMIGPTAYDVASLIQDARVTIPKDMSDRLLSAYIDARQALGPFDEQTFRRDLAVMAAQRACKLAGLWVRLMKRDGKPVYMKHMPRTLDYIRVALQHDALSPLREWCAKARMGILES